MYDTSKPMHERITELTRKLCHKSRDELIEALDVAYILLDTDQKVFDLIPPCPHHGSRCIPNMCEWVRAHKYEPIDKIEYDTAWPPVVGSPVWLNGIKYIPEPGICKEPDRPLRIKKIEISKDSVHIEAENGMSIDAPLVGSE